MAHDDELSRLHRPAAQTRHARVTWLLHEAGVARAEKRFADAAARLDSVAALSPAEPALARCRAQLALDLGRVNDALAALGPVPATPEDPRATWLRVEALARLERFDEAAALADLVLARHDGARIEQVLLRARIAEQRSSERAAGALRVIDAGLARWPGAWPLVERALALEQATGHDEAALARIDALRTAGHDGPVWLARRGDVLAHAQRMWEARAAWTDALAGLEADTRPSAADRALAEALRVRLAVPRSETLSSPNPVGVPR